MAAETAGTADTVPTDSQFRRFVETFTENKLALFGLVLIISVAILTALAPQIAPYGPREQDYSAVLAGPSADHPFGTDALGRDIFSRILFGYRTVLTITLSGVVAAFTMGTTIGLLAGYRGGWTDEFIMRGVDVLMSFPSLILALALIAAIGPSKWGVALVLAVAYTPIFARVARGEAVSITEELFVRGLEIRGASRSRIIFRHILPNAVGPLTVAVTLQFAFGILTTATLSFLGVGIQPPDPSLGRMLADGKDFLATAWWFSIFPGVAIMLPVIGFNTIGDGLRDTLDPRQVNR